MSSGPACLDKTHRHVVTARRCNYSAFNGYHRTRSDYSEVTCAVTRLRWRTKSAYVDRLPDANQADWDAIGRPIYI